MASQGTLERLLEVERGEIGYDRYKDPQHGTKYGRWYAEMTGQAWYGANGVAYCAMFQSWCLAQAGVTAVGMPGAYTPSIQAKVIAAHKNHRAAQAKQGDLVLFDWDDSVERATDGPEHIGFVESNNGRYLTTIEGNTNNGKVARRTRAYGSVTVCWTPGYSGSAPAPAPSPSSGGALDVDGWLGTKSVTEWQRQMGTTVDGVISGQAYANKRYLERVVAIQWGNCGSQLVIAIQHKVGCAADGYMGPDTVRHIQAFVGTAQDGYLGPETAKAVQRKLNAGGWR